MKPIMAALAAFVFFGLLPSGVSGQQAAGSPQQGTTPAGAPHAPNADEVRRRAEAYYHYAMAKVFEENYEATGRSEFATQAIDSYKKAYELDPHASEIGERLAEMYAKAQRIRDAVTEAQEIITRDPDNLPARRLLARIYLRTLGDMNPRVSQRETATRAIEQFREILRIDPADAESAVWLARLHRLRNEHEQAADVLRKLLAAQPDNEQAVEQLAQLMLDIGDHRQAINLLAPRVQRNPSSALLGLLGEAYTQAQDFTGAEETFRRALEVNPREPGPRRGLAQALNQQNKHEEAITEYERLIEIDPDDAESYLRLAQIYRKQRQLDDAEEALLQARERAPGNLEVIYNEAMLYEAQGRFDDSIRVLSDAVTRVKANPARLVDSRRTLAILYEQLGRLYREVENYPAAINTFGEMTAMGGEEERRGREMIIDTLRVDKQITQALEESRKMLDASPGDRGATLTYAMLLGESGSTDEAAKMLRGLLGSGDDRGVWLALAQIYERGRRFSDAEAAAREAEKLGSRAAENEMVYFLLGAIYERQKRFDEAEVQFRKALAANPSNASVLNYLGYMLAERGERLEEAVSLIQRALHEDPHNGAYLDSLGWAYYQLNRLVEAEEYLRRAAERSSNDPVIREHLGDVYMKLGRLDQAAAEWERSLTAWKRALPTEFEADRVAELEKKLTRVKQRIAQSGRSDTKN